MSEKKAKWEKLLDEEFRRKGYPLSKEDVKKVLKQKNIEEAWFTEIKKTKQRPKPRRRTEPSDFPSGEIRSKEEVNKWFESELPDVDDIFANNIERYEDRIFDKAQDCRDECTKDAEEEILSEIRDYYDEATLALKKVIIDNKPIYRMIAVCDIEDLINDIETYNISSYKDSFLEKKRYRDMGEYWSWDKHKAKIYEPISCGLWDKPKEVLIKAKVPFKSAIDIYRTLDTNIRYEGGEKEITLKPHQIIDVDYICKIDKSKKQFGKNECKTKKHKISKYMRT